MKIVKVIEKAIDLTAEAAGKATQTAKKVVEVAAK